MLIVAGKKLLGPWPLMTALPWLLSLFDVGEKDNRRQIFSGHWNATIMF